MEIDAKASASPQTTPSSPAPALTKRINPVWPPEQKENVSKKNYAIGVAKKKHCINAKQYRIQSVEFNIIIG